MAHPYCDKARDGQATAKARYADGGATKLAGDVVNFPISMQQSDARRVSGMKNPTAPSKEAQKPLLGPGAASARGGKVKSHGDSVKRK